MYNLFMLMVFPCLLLYTYYILFRFKLQLFLLNVTFTLNLLLSGTALYNIAVFPYIFLFVFVFGLFIIWLSNSGQVSSRQPNARAAESVTSFERRRDIKKPNQQPQLLQPMRQCGLPTPFLTIIFKYQLSFTVLTRYFKLGSTRNSNFQKILFSFHMSSVCLFRILFQIIL